MPAARIIFPGILIAAFAALAVPATKPVAAADQVSVEKGRVDVTLTHSEKQYSLSATIRVSLLLRNPSNKRDTARREFPIAAPPGMRFPQQERPWCRVTVNEIAVPFESKRIVQLTERIQA